MTRQEFIRKSMMLGIGLPMLSSILTSCDEQSVVFPTVESNFSGKVLIVGAGAAGLAAGYMLKRYGVDFQIVEASAVYGGRLKRADDFADFPIDLGAEWIHIEPKVLSDILSNPQADADIDIIIYNPQTIKSWNNGKLKANNFIRNFYSEWKFKNTTWYGFFEKYIVPSVQDKLVLNKPIVEIDYHSDQVQLKAEDGETFQADKVLLTVPVTILQNDSIRFTPTLPPAKTEAINSVLMGDGIKIFVEFKEKFYPDILGFGNIFQALSAEDKFVYDAAFRKDSNRHVLALFAINDKAAAYTDLVSEEKIIEAFLAELDEIFEGKASANYIKHVIQNWSAEPYIQGAYSYDFEGNKSSVVDAFKEPVQERLYFAGEALSIDYQSTVHGACQSAFEAVEKILK